MKKQFLLSIIFCALMAPAMWSQDVTIASPDFSTCDGSMNDTNPVGQYAPNEDETITICAEAPETVVNLYWISFNLGDGDVLQIFDGNSTSSTLIGSFTGQDLALTDTYSTNPSGCLTLHWTSDGSDEGEFGCIVNCGLPCAKPTTAISVVGEPVLPVLACPDELFTFDASGTTFLGGMVFQSVLWDFGDGTTNTSDWPTVQHSYPNPGIYKVNVYVTDSNGCQSLNVVNAKIYVSTDPIFSAVTDDNLVCVGQEVNMAGYAEGVTYEVIPDVDFGGGIYIPDNEGCFYDTLFITGFPSDQVITDISDLESFYINYEHSYMSDFTISFFCPDGSGLVAHNQGAGGYWLGEPIDIEDPTQPGIGYDYWFAPDAVNPTWADAAMEGGEYIGSMNQLVSGTYAAVGDWNTLVGCPLNGPWIIEVCDIVGADDGFIFDWAVVLNPEVYPEDLTFTPFFDLTGCEDTYWSGSFIADSGLNCDSIVVIPTAEGNYTYTYTATNNHGCTYTQDINVVAYPGPIPFAGEDFYFCGPEVQLNGIVTNPVAGINYVYSWTPGGPLTGENTANPYLDDNAISATTDFSFSVYPSDDADCIVRDTVTAIVPEYPLTQPLDTLEFCSGSNNILFAPDQTGSTYSYVWYYSADGVEYEEAGTTPSGNFLINDGGYYYVEVYEPYCNFMTSSPYYVRVKACEILIPNIFTPNGSGGNDTFEIKGLEDFPNSTLEVYNRWGTKVYENANYKNTWTGDDFAEGTYFFILGIKTQSGMEYHEGDLTILRK